MKILLDLQGLQSSSRERGIGRLTRQLALAMIAEGGHEFHVLLGEDLSHEIDAVETEFRRLLPPGRVHSFGPYGPTACVHEQNVWRARAAALLREARIAEIAPDIVHVGSLFEGFTEDFITSVGRLPADHATAVTLYDLIPLADPDRYLGSPAYKRHYLRNVQDLKRADLLLSISDYSKREAIDLLHLPEERIAVMFAGVGDHFRPARLSAPEKDALLRRFGLTRRFVLFVGAADPRKNLELLIRAYMKLPAGLRSDLDLVFAGKLVAHEKDAIIAAARRNGVPPYHVIFTGYIADADLIALYGLCDVLVFPSTHEGFGLPPLEAMACGAPVLVADNTSLPEVVGRQDCMFDPFDVESLRERLLFALGDREWREAMRAYGPQRAKLFTWRAAARRALDAFETLHARRLREREAVRLPERMPLPAPVRRPRMAFVSPLPPDHSGIADYSAELLRELLDHYEIDLVHPDGTTDDAWLAGNCAVRDIVHFERHAGEYDRIVYSFGNSTFHTHMFRLLARFPGTVILHDAFLSNLAIHLLHVAGKPADAIAEEIYASHGVTGLRLLTEEGYDGVARDLTMSGGVFRNAHGVIVHSDFAAGIAEAAFGPTVRSMIAVVPHLRSLPKRGGRKAARKALGIPPDAFVVASFGIVDPRKLNLLTAEAFSSSGLAADPENRLVFVGPHQEPYAGEVLAAATADHPDAGVVFAGRLSDTEYGQYMEAADIAVQLRTESRGETSGATLGAMAYGLPTLATDLGPVAELPDGCLVKLEPDASAEDVAAILLRLRRDPEDCRRLGEAARAYIAGALEPRAIGRRLSELVEGFAATSPRVSERVLVEAVADIAAETRPTSNDLARLAGHLQALYPPPRLRQLLCDVSGIAREDLRTGIERVVRAVLERLIAAPPDGFRIEPVVIRDGVPHYARAFLRDRLGLPTGPLDDTPVAFGPGDRYLGLDWVPDRIPDAAPWLGRFRRAGGGITFVVYDLLPLEMPRFFPDWLEALDRRWLDTITTCADHLACISAATADSVARLADPATIAGRADALEIGWFHLGHDLAVGMPTTGVPDDGEAVLAAMVRRPTFLIVGTVEPRKGHVDALDAFEALWAEGRNVALVVVGKEGWMVQELADRIRGHAEHGARLVWLPKVSDEYLDTLYGAATAVVVASHGEGFGLPLVEGAARGTPIIARDLPVFREVGGAGADYFDDRPGGLAAAIRSWLAARQSGRVVAPVPMARLSWAEATAQLLAIVRGERVYRTLDPDEQPAGRQRRIGASS
ncbi:glycosyltransferase [Methylobacterium haplocladii]|uniref:Mannosyltransferase A n=1 Tax=Methylobacterium haplocladii TaxID=1176176 RepID=A0A512IMV6_9HYPH|nr:glycosyltransferase [Methylobacterium haplocladii]GEO99015.1 mannosyltransferase A [Methylobacterium haplocladii]GJD84138.1 D-inositol-3-phosphate glycosyltransferase [Methylobacterium haplocladii]GLS58985.1 mannosyltransferase A [Methylobacterium haplocladii]